MGKITTRPCSKAEAKALTERIRKGVDQLWSLLLEAHERKAWKVLGYETWDAYIAGEFNMSRRRSYQLLDQGRVIREIGAATGQDVNHGSQITERTARELAADLPAAKAEIVERAASGEKPTEVAEEIAKRRRAEQKAAREAQQAENDRQREAMRAQLPESIRRGEEAKARNGSVNAAVPRGLTPAERIAELEESVAALEADNAKLAEENKRFAEMKVLFDQGGFEAVISAKDEEIRVLKTRVETESGDKATWAGRAKFWRKAAMDLGYSSDTIIPLDEEAAHG